MQNDYDEYIEETEVYYRLAWKHFSKQDYVSSGSLQQALQIPYHLARSILDRLIAEQYCEKQFGAYPCRIFHYSTN